MLALKCLGFQNPNFYFTISRLSLAESNAVNLKGIIWSAYKTSKNY
jgi:hypothetical protein